MTTNRIDEDTLFGGSVTASPDVLMQELPDEELIFLNLRSESYFGLDEVGTRMYRALTGTPTVEEAYALLAERFDVEPEQLRRDLRVFVERLIDQGLVELRA